ncbi:MAG: metallophosphoesterase [Gemmatimonadetes bacterium]|nr:metallophosphoesterase [Gemmatimonadota bacterium]
MILGLKPPRPTATRQTWSIPVLLLTTVCGSLELPAQDRAPAPRPFTFVVLGHLRGDANGPNPKLGELLEEVEALAPDLLFLAGDMIWGDVLHYPVDSSMVESEWSTLDSALATVSASIYRTPGNHDINDQVTRDIYLARYGRPPQRVSYGGSRFLLVNSGWLPEDDDVPAGREEYVRGKDLDEAQIAFLRRELSDTAAYEHAFVFMHHLLWWGDDASPWWQVIHPILAAGKVRAVFSGDYGPMKFSHLTRDGVAYYQTSIEDTVSVAIQRALPSSWRLSSQFDNYLSVAVDGPAVEVTVHTIAEVSSGAFTPARWTEINQGLPRPGVARQVWNVIGSPKRLAALAIAAIVYSVLVAAIAVRWRAKRP